MAKAVKGFENSRRAVGSGGVAVPVGSSHSQSHFRCTGAYVAEAKGWPGVLTYRNLLSNTGSSGDWIDGEEVYAEELNGNDLESGQRYECHVYGIKPWTNEDDEDVKSMFVLVDVSAGGGGEGGGACTGSKWYMGLDTTPCFRLTVISAMGRCSDIDTSQILILSWDEGNSRWETGDDAAADPGDDEDDFIHDGPGDHLGPMRFWVSEGRARMSIDGIEGGEECSSPGQITFAFGGSGLCSGTVSDQCGDNTFRVRLTCVCCPDPNWDGPGYYCTTADPPCQQFLTAPCVGDYTILGGGPYPTEGDCTAACGGGGAVDVGLCCPSGVPSTLTITATGDDTGSGTLTWNGSTAWTGGFTSGNGLAVTFSLTVTGTGPTPADCTWNVNVGGDSPLGNAPLSLVGDCDPFVLQGGPFTNWTSDPDVLVTLTVTE